MLGTVRAGRKRAGVFLGDLRSSAQKTKYMRERKAVLKQQREKEDLQTGVAPLQGAWNSSCLRLGDFVGGASGCEHPNTFSLQGVLLQAWRQLGRNKTSSGGVDGSHRALNMLATVSGAAWERQSAWMNSEMQHLREAHACPVISGYYDASPMRVRFGQLQEDVMPHARYPVKDADGKWVSVGLKEYLRTMGSKQSVLRWGTVEVLVQSFTCTYLHPTDPRLLKSLRYICRPLVLEAGNSSCLMSAHEQECPQLGTAGIRKVCEACPLALFNEQPDNHSANMRKQQCLFSEMPANCLCVGGVCGAHQGHRVIGATHRECIGDIYAIHWTCSNASYQQRLQMSLLTVLREELLFIRGEPDQLVLGKHRSIAKWTKLRREECITRDPSDEPVSAYDDHTPAVLRFLDMWNGDWTVDRCIHVCPAGHCRDREDAVKKMHAAGTWMMMDDDGW